MRISTSIEAIAAIATGVIVAGAIVLATGCAAAPDYTPTRAALSGSVELDTPSGVVLLELGTGVVFGGDGSVAVRRVDIETEVEAPAGTVVVHYTSPRCTVASVDLSGWVIRREWGCSVEPVPAASFADDPTPD